MIITVWWEDARQAGRSKNYGPDRFLARCIADDLNCELHVAQRMFTGQPKKGAGTIKRLLEDEAALVLDRGPLCAVLDYDKILDWWPSGHKPNSCHTAICGAIRKAAPGGYYLVLLHQNIETLVTAACEALGIPVPGKSPQERDDVLEQLVFDRSVTKRRAARGAVPGFDRLVSWVVSNVNAPTPRP